LFALEARLFAGVIAAFVSPDHLFRRVVDLFAEEEFLCGEREGLCGGTRTMFAVVKSMFGWAGIGFGPREPLFAGEEILFGVRGRTAFVSGVF
jgi:hypothetical protein